jgi:hypothetical protein
VRARVELYQILPRLTQKWDFQLTHELSPSRYCTLIVTRYTVQARRTQIVVPVLVPQGSGLRAALQVVLKAQSVRFVVQLPIRTNVRAIMARLGMLVGLVHGQFNRVESQCARLCPRDFAVTVLDLVGCTTEVMDDDEGERGRRKRRKKEAGMSHISVVPQTKSTRKRYMRVAAIDIVISEGS